MKQTNDKSKYMKTLTFRLRDGQINFHHDHAYERHNLTGIPVGTKDEIGYISTGIHYEGARPEYVWWMQALLEQLCIKGKGNVTESDCIKTVLYARAIAEGVDYMSLESLHSHFDGSYDISL